MRTALQLSPQSHYLEAGLAERLQLVRWFELDPVQQSTWLEANAGSVRAVVTGGHVGCGNALMSLLPSLRLIAINGVGFDKVDLAFARERGVRVTVTPGALTEDVADLAVGLVIALLRGIPGADKYVREGAWLTGETPLARKVSGRRFGILGLGRIGSEIARRLSVFGPVSYTSPSAKDIPYDFHASVLDLASAVEVLVVACPANAATLGLVNKDVLASLGPEGWLVNVARGSIVDEAALIAALEAGSLAGAALDVFEDEPNVPEALRANRKVVLTPHIASATIETRKRMADIVLENLDAVLAGRAPPAALV